MMNGTKAALHRTNRLLGALEPNDFLWLEPYLEIVDLPRGRVIYEIGEPIHYTYFPHDAIISLITVLQSGGAVEVAIFGREAAVGFVSALVTRQSFGRYITQAPGTASRLPVERLNDAFANRANMRHILFRFTEAFLAQTLQTVACNAVHTVEARFCRVILSTRDRIDKDEIPLTHEALADMLGVQRSTVSSVTSALQRAGLIHQGRGTIRITDRDGIEEMACECYQTIRQSFEKLLPGALSSS
ncbi:CRP-like cAMP-binding protein [Microvirga flocculans]|uniref:CRP-like cAMP-binding protein n=1 Tax=Microvirga flocculans TaxID=217168 RepID=A0A7W6N6V8_9HYPH|nr:Crp/Fnr family transcriptional regulator [Microvirga flocculans]MBB4039463.1 CRP-like cAMP-binding protein [Microvirga flocculans]